MANNILAFGVVARLPLGAQMTHRIDTVCNFAHEEKKLIKIYYIKHQLSDIRPGFGPRLHMTAYGLFP